MLSPQQRLIIVDDVVTRGATLLACYARLSEAYPDVPISVFALIRTMSGAEIAKMLDPVTGTIKLQNRQVYRKP
jgi:orotate phosphoribosyltransferase-like protein